MCILLLNSGDENSFIDKLSLDNIYEIYKFLPETSKKNIALTNKKYNIINKKLTTLHSLQKKPTTKIYPNIMNIQTDYRTSIEYIYIKYPWMFTLFSPNIDILYNFLFEMLKYEFIVISKFDDDVPYGDFTITYTHLKRNTINKVYGHLSLNNKGEIYIFGTIYMEVYDIIDNNNYLSIVHNIIYNTIGDVCAIFKYTKYRYYIHLYKNITYLPVKPRKNYQDNFPSTNNEIRFKFPYNNVCYIEYYGTEAMSLSQNYFDFYELNKHLLVFDKLIENIDGKFITADINCKKKSPDHKIMDICEFKGNCYLRIREYENNEFLTSLTLKGIYGNLIKSSNYYNNEGWTRLYHILNSLNGDIISNSFPKHHLLPTHNELIPDINEYHRVIVYQNNIIDILYTKDQYLYRLSITDQYKNKLFTFP